MSTALIWFKKDLRLHDNQAVFESFAKHKTVIPFYCFENSDFGKTKSGFHKTHSFRAQFLIESVSDLKNNLIRIGSDLIIRKGSTVELLSEIIEQYSVTDIYTQKEIHAEEIQIQDELKQTHQINWHFNAGFSLYHVNDATFPISETPKVFTEFRKKLEKTASVRSCIETPRSGPELPNKIEIGQIPTLEHFGLTPKVKSASGVIQAVGGETHALKRLKYYLFDTTLLSTYKQTRNGLLGADYSSKLSIWLWNGCISPRKIYWEVKKYENLIQKNQSTYWLIFELIWRDYFKFISIKHGNDIFKLNGISDRYYKVEKNTEALNKWKNGDTGIPFIDANMRELNQTGFMSNRGRQNVASFFVKELKLDWRIGAEYFESQLIDYDVASNYGNWMYVAGVGNDPRDRYFNIMLQAKRYDPQGKYVKKWVPELCNIEQEFVHHPWTRKETLFSQKEQLTYPQPIVEPAYWQKHY